MKQRFFKHEPERGENVKQKTRARSRSWEDVSLEKAQKKEHIPSDCIKCYI